LKNILDYLLILIFGLLTILVIFGFTQPVDDIILPIFTIPSEFELLVSILSDFMGTYIWFIICIPLFISKKVENIIIASLILINLTIAVIIKAVLSIMIPRTRPPNYTPSILEGNSYPSGHVMRAFACPTPIILRLHSVFYSLYILGVITSLTRMMLQVHYFTDILSGLILGIIIGLITNKKLANLIKETVNKYLHTNGGKNNVKNLYLC
jgi:membrane-associated phospholipid phosphatase